MQAIEAVILAGHEAHAHNPGSSLTNNIDNNIDNNTETKETPHHEQTDHSDRHPAVRHTI